MTPIRMLEVAKALISSPEKWTQGVSARDARGRHVDYGSQQARCWCVLGAMMKIDVGLDNFFGRQGAIWLLEKTMKSIWPSYSGLGSWNDAPERTHADVMRLFTAAAVFAQQVPWALRFV